MDRNSIAFKTMQGSRTAESPDRYNKNEITTPIVYSKFNKISPYGLTIIAVVILFTLGCENRFKKEPEYISVITTLQKEDSTVLYQRIERDKMTGRVYKIVKTDTSFIKKNISYFLVPFIKRAACVKEIHDLSNNDSCILVVEIKEDHDIFEACYEIRDILKANKTNIPMNICDPQVIRGRLNYGKGINNKHNY